MLESRQVMLNDIRDNKVRAISGSRKEQRKVMESKPSSQRHQLQVVRSTPSRIIVSTSSTRKYQAHHLSEKQKIHRQLEISRNPLILTVLWAAPAAAATAAAATADTDPIESHGGAEPARPHGRPRVARADLVCFRATSTHGQAMTGIQMGGRSPQNPSNAMVAMAPPQYAFPPLTPTH